MELKPVSQLEIPLNRSNRYLLNTIAIIRLHLKNYTELLDPVKGPDTICKGKGIECLGFPLNSSPARRFVLILNKQLP
jgi:hypothetical protein